MNGTVFSIGAGLLFSVSGARLAGTSIGQGVISFNGSIIESPCVVSAQADALNLSDCPAQARGTRVSLQAVEPRVAIRSLGHDRVDVKLVADSGRAGRYYNQQFTLVDSAGEPVTSGVYLITLTTP